MVRVITNGGTARIVLERTASRSEMGAVVAGVRDCADAGVEELVIAVPEAEHGWLQVLEEALLDTPDPLRIWVAVGEDDLDDEGRPGRA